MALNGSQMQTATHEPRIKTMDSPSEETCTCPACKKCELAVSVSEQGSDRERMDNFSFKAGSRLMASPSSLAGSGAEWPQLRRFPGTLVTQSLPIPTLPFVATVEELR